MAHSINLRAVVGLMRAALGLVPTERQLQALFDAEPRAIVRIASAHAVLPLLSQGLSNSRIASAMAPELGLFLNEMHKANTSRNAALRAQLLEIGEALHDVGISGVALKGAVELLAPAYPHGSRYIGDIDILVPEPQLPTASDRLIALGYAFHKAEEHSSDHHHLPVLWHAERPTAVELHRRVASGHTERFLPASLILDEACSIGLNGLNIPSPRCRLLHLLVHNRRRSEIGKPWPLFLRDFAELACISPLLDENDWAFARGRFKAENAIAELDGFCEVARILLQATEDEAASSEAAGVWAAEALGNLEAPRRLRARYVLGWLRYHARRFNSDRAMRMRYLSRLSNPRFVIEALRQHVQDLRNIA